VVARVVAPTCGTRQSVVPLQHVPRTALICLEQLGMTRLKLGDWPWNPTLSHRSPGEQIRWIGVKALGTIGHRPRSGSSNYQTGMDMHINFSFMVFLTFVP
jgi:hypothetical protein